LTIRPASHSSRKPIGIRFTTDDAEAAHATLQAAGGGTDEILRWPGVPPMFGLRRTAAVMGAARAGIGDGGS
jgi:hypothetical protein